MRRVRAIALLAALVLTSCTPDRGAEVGDTPKPPPPTEDGIGGTGIVADPRKPFDDEGIGGTGIVGAITGFGSIVVNGLHVAYDPSMLVEGPTGPLPARNLQIGHVVALIAADTDGALTARRIARRIAVAGPVGEVDLPGNRIRVLGQWVAVVGGTQAPDFPNGLAVGDAVTVSGFRRPDGTITATRIEPRPTDAPGIVTDRFDRLIALRAVTLSAAVRRPAGDAIVALSGPVRDGRLIGTGLVSAADRPVIGTADRVSLQGYATGRAETAFQLRDTRATNRAGLPAPGAALVIVEGPLEDGPVLRVERLRPAEPEGSRPDLILRGMFRLPGGGSLLSPERNTPALPETRPDDIMRQQGRPEGIPPPANRR